jgi:hypothetical membrane protein
MRWLAACGIIAPILDVLIMAWQGALNPGYSHVRQYISELGEAGRPHAGVFSVGCLLWGLLFAGFAVALRRGLALIPMEGKTANRLPIRTIIS